MKHRTLLAALVLAPSLGALAADAPRTPAAVDTSFLKLYAETRGFMLGRPQKPKFTPDGKTVLFLRAEAKTPKMKLFAFDVAARTTKELLSPELLLGGGDENLTQEEKARRERQRVSVGGFADYHLDPDGGRVLVSLSGRLHVFDRGTGKAQELKTGPGPIDPKWSPDGKMVSYVRDHDVYVYDLAAGAERAVTTGGTAVKTHGLAEFVAQEEMDRYTGYWWSPDAKFIAYEEADHTGVETWYVADPLRPDVRPQEQFYPRPGKKNVAVRLGIKPVTGGETVWVEWDRAKYEYLAAVSWQKYGPPTILVQNRKQQTMRYLIVDPPSGKVVTIGGAEDPAFLNLHPDCLRWWKDGRRFLLLRPNADNTPMYATFLLERLPERLSFRSGSEDAATTLEFEGGIDDFREMVAFNPENGTAIYTRSLGSVGLNTLDSTQTLLFRRRFPIDDTNEFDVNELIDPLPVCKEPGTYSGAFNTGQTLAAITKTTLRSMPESTVFRADWTAVGSLPSVALEPDFKPNVTVEKVGDYWTAVVRPRNFDKAKKYPVIVDVYGGPHHLHVVRAMRNWLIPQWLADQGFVVVAVENRGTPGRGWSWEKAVQGKFGTVPLDDQVKGLNVLCDKFPELDRTRVGIVGWSFGGYMAANAVLRRPDVFAAAVAGAPVTDWEDYDTHYTERYMGLLPENRKAYDESSLIPLAKDLRRPLLLVHGTADDNVYYRHTLKLSDALFRAGKDFDVLPLPGVTHMYSADPAVAERLWARSVGFFKTHLGEPK